MSVSEAVRAKARPPVYRKHQFLGLIVFLALALTIRAAFVGDLNGAYLANLFLFNSILVLGFYWIFGVSGQFAFSQASFAALGAYISFSVTREHAFIWGLLGAMVVAGVLSLVLALLLQRASEFYFAIGTLGAGELILLVCRKWEGLTGFVNGEAFGAPPISLFGYDFLTDYSVFLLMLGVTAVVLVVIILLERSPLQRETVAERDRPRISVGLGIPGVATRVRAMVLGSVIAAVAGVLFAHWNGFVSKEAFSLNLMLSIYLMIVVGGRHSLWGPVVGAAFYVYLTELVKPIETYQQVIYGALLMIAMIVFPEGIVGLRQQVSTFLRRRGSPDPTGDTHWYTAPVGRVQGAVSWAGRLFERGQPTPAHAVALQGVVAGYSDAPSILDEPLAASAAAANGHPRVGSGPGDRGDRQVGEPILEAEGIDVHFGGVHAVRDVSLTLHRHEILGLIGPNGSGKSTFVNAVTGVVHAGGRVRVDGHDVRLGHPRAIWGAGVLRTYQTPQTFLDLSCLENVLLGTRHRRRLGVAWATVLRPLMMAVERQRWQEGMAALERFGLAGLWDSSAAALSYGQQRMLELARVVASRPSIVLLDEPSAGLNATETANLARHLQALASEGVSLLVIDHKIDFINSLCDRVAVVESGSLVALGSPEVVWADERVVTAYLGDHA